MTQRKYTSSGHLPKVITGELVQAGFRMQERRFSTLNFSITTSEFNIFSGRCQPAFLIVRFLRIISRCPVLVVLESLYFLRVLQLPLLRNPDPGSHSSHFWPPPRHGYVRTFLFIARRIPYFLRHWSTRIDSDHE